MYSPWQSEKAWFLAAAAPWFFCQTTATFADANWRAMASVWSVDPSSTTMISMRLQAWLSADFILSAIQDSALNEGIRTDTSGSIDLLVIMENPSVRR